MNHRRRVERLEYQQLIELAAEAGRPYGLSAEDVLAEARRFVRLSPAVPAAELDALLPAVDPHEAKIPEALRPREGRR